MRDSDFPITYPVSDENNYEMHNNKCYKLFRNVGDAFTEVYSLFNTGTFIVYESYKSPGMFFISSNPDAYGAIKEVVKLSGQITCGEDTTNTDKLVSQVKLLRDALERIADMGQDKHLDGPLSRVWMTAEALKALFNCSALDK